MPATLQVEPAETCPICGTTGRPSHQDLPDGFGSTRNLWSLRQCPRRGCRHAWPDPTPVDADLPKAYAGYPVHEPARRGPPRKPTNLAGRVYEDLLRRTGIHERRQALDLFRLPPGNGARLLEVGCGNGARLVEMQGHGYEVEGQDVSEVAVARAAALGMRVHLGTLEGLRLGEGAYDVLVMNHVLEHVRDPTAFLAECRRLLRSGGRLVSIQPNGASLAHRVFGPDWVGLDLPRHLHVFTPRSAAQAARQAGFARVRASTTYLRNQWCTAESLRRRAMRRGRASSGPHRRIPYLGQMAAIAASPFGRGGGDEIVLECQT